MGKMSKKNLEDLKRDDPKDNNWEIQPEAEKPVCDPVQVSEPVEPVPEEAVLKKALPAELAIFEGLPESIQQKAVDAWHKVDPALRHNNPVWKWSISDKDVVFIFQTGQKARISL